MRAQASTASGVVADSRPTAEAPALGPPLRIIAGDKKRMRLVAPLGLAVRPTTDFVRGAAMSQLGGFFNGGRVLDLCAGTGSVALEFLSRGCAEAVAVETDSEALTLLRQNAAHTKLADRLRIVAIDVELAVALLGKERAQFAYVWFDPPWHFSRYVEVLQAIAANNLLQVGGEVLVESREPLAAEQLAPVWRVVVSRRYGAGWLSRWTLGAAG